MKRLLPAVLLLLSCSTTASAPEAGAHAVVIGSETSFGMCVGYCRSELAIDSAGARLTYSSRDAAGHPPVTHTIALTPAVWRALVEGTDRATFARLDSVYGCPDCADGGAEVIELEWSGESQRVIFEYGRPPEPIQALRERIWQLRGRFPEPHGQ